MSAATKLQRARDMMFAYEHGHSPSEIAREMGVTKRTVYIRLNAQGVEFERGRPDDIWSLPEDERRTEISRRAARGARAALREITSEAEASNG